jgi:hypothetical protein
MSSANRSGRGAESKNMRLVGHCDLDGEGEGSQLIRHGDYVYVAHMNPDGGTSIVDVRDPTKPRLVGRLPMPNSATHGHKVQIVGDVLAVNWEHYNWRRGAGAPSAPDMDKSAGVQFYDISNPLKPQPISFFHTGGHGVHRMWYADENYLYASVWAEGFRERIISIVDVSDVSHPREVGRWWLPGMWTAGGEQLPDGWPTGLRYGMHHAIVANDRAYIGCLDAGLSVVDVSDPSQPRTVGRLQWPHDDAHNSHTALPLPERKLVVVTEEGSDQAVLRYQRYLSKPGARSYVRVIDVSDETHPTELSQFPFPEGYEGEWPGPHNLHENRPNSFSSEQLIYSAHFNAGVRVVDISDPREPKEVAWYVPETPEGQTETAINDVYVDEDELIYISDRLGGGIYILERTQT